MAGRPNIILINCDDLGCGDLGCYGSTANATPTLDRMAREGTQFQVWRDGGAVRELYDLASDVGESTDRSGREPGMVAELSALADECRRDIGDEATGTFGASIRPKGRVARADTLAHFDPTGPFLVAMYDLSEHG